MTRKDQISNAIMIAMQEGLVDSLSERVAEILSPESSDDPLRDSLLKKYAERKPTKFYQFDGFACGVEGSCLPDTDADGDELWGPLETHELMHSSNVRVLVKADTTPEVAIRLMQKLLKWMENIDARRLMISKEGRVKVYTHPFAYPPTDIPF